MNNWRLPSSVVTTYNGWQLSNRSSIAGVLAHEVQHALKWHATRAVLDQGSTSLLITAVTGDCGSLGLQPAPRG